MIYVDIVRQALRDMPSQNLGARRVVYDQLRSALKGVLEGQEPPLDPREKAIELRLLEVTIRRFEVDLRAGTDVTASEYVPEGVDQEQARLYAVKTAVRVTPAPKEKPLEGQDELMAALSREMTSLSHAGSPAGHGEAALRLMTVYAVLLRVVRELAVAQGRFGLFLFVFEPVALIGLVITAYSFTGQSAVMNMDLVAFSITGIIPWMLFRMTTIRVASSFEAARDLLSLPAIRSYTLIVGQGFVMFAVYSLVMVSAVFLSIVVANCAPPDNIVQFAVLWGGLWVFALASGLILGPCYVLWSATRRITVIGQRMISMFSAVAFVSEQFPTELKAYVLWNPILHVIQLLRSAYFVSYKSQDASLSYFLVAAGVFIALGSLCERFIRPRVEPA